MFRIDVSGSGMLRSLEAVVSAQLPPPQTAMDEGALFRAAGFDLGTFREVELVGLPKVPFDSVKAWKGPHPGLPGVELTVQTAMWQGRPVAFSTV
jgi:hypothetical protein